MLHKIKAAFTSLALIGLLAAPAIALPTTVYASDNFQQSKNAACDGIGLTGTDCGSTAANNRVSNLFKTIVNTLTVIVGVAAVIMIIVSGFKYITSGGDSNAVSSAKTSLIYAIVGLIIVALAQFIINVVLREVQ